MMHLVKLFNVLFLHYVLKLYIGDIVKFERFIALHPLCPGTKRFKVIWRHAPFSLLPSLQLFRFHFASPTLHSGLATFAHCTNLQRIRLTQPWIPNGSLQRLLLSVIRCKAAYPDCIKERFWNRISLKIEISYLKDPAQYTRLISFTPAANKPWELCRAIPLGIEIGSLLTKHNSRNHKQLL